MPLYPEIRVRTKGRSPLALVAAVRQALRRAGIERREIARFSTEAMNAVGPDEIDSVCSRWIGRADAD